MTILELSIIILNDYGDHFTKACREFNEHSSKFVDCPSTLDEQFNLKE